MLIRIHPANPSERLIRQVADILRDGGIVILPTDTVYSVCCDATHIKAVEKLAEIKGVSLEKANFSFICQDLSHISDYVRPFDTKTYKIMKKALPGPFTFILNANSKVSSRFFGPKSKKQTLGIRVPDNKIIHAIVVELGNPLAGTSVHDPDALIEYTTDPELIFEAWKEKVDAVVDGGIGHLEASTVVDFTGSEPEILRQGIGDFESLL